MFFIKTKTFVLFRMRTFKKQKQTQRKNETRRFPNMKGGGKLIRLPVGPGARLDNGRPNPEFSAELIPRHK